MNIIYRICAHYGFSTPRILYYWGVLIFKYNYYDKKLKERKGKCLHCGKCCSYCTWREKRNNKIFCKHYKSKPFLCGIYPINETDKERVNPNCGFYWGVKKKGTAKK